MYACAKRATITLELMNTLRKIFLFLIVLGFSGLLFLNSFVWVGRQTVMDRNVTESWLSEGKVYDNFVDELAKTVEKEQSKKHGTETSESDANVDTAALTRAATVAFPPKTLQENFETVLNSVYDWLEGKTEKIVFNLDLTEERQAFIDALGNEAFTKLSSLPACRSEQISEDFDPFSAGCLPTRTDINAQVGKFKTEISGSSEGILQDSSIDGSDLAFNVKGTKTRIDEFFSEAPSAFNLLNKLPFLLAVLVVISSGLIVLLSRPKLKGLKKLTWLFGPTGGILIFLGTAGKYIAEGLFLGSRQTNSLSTPLIKQISSSLSKWHLIIGGTYLALGVICIVVYLILKKRSPESDAPKVDDVKEAEPKEEPKEPIKEVKTPSKIQ